MKRPTKKNSLLLFVFTGFLLGFVLTIDTWSQFTIKDIFIGLKNLNDHNPFWAGLAFILIFWLTTSVGIPVALFLTVSCGITFGFYRGLSLVFIATGLSCATGYFAGRTLLRERILANFPEHMKAVDRGINELGHIYLVNLRLLPVIPFSMVNLLMGASSMAFYRFLKISLLSSIIPMAIYVNSGSTLRSVDSMGDILSTRTLVAIILLANIPLISRRILHRSIKHRPAKTQNDDSPADSTIASQNKDSERLPPKGA